MAIGKNGNKMKKNIKWKTVNCNDIELQFRAEKRSK